MATDGSDPDSSSIQQPILTVGHSNRTGNELVELLKQHQTGCLIDVRRRPTSRRHPDFRRDNLRRRLDASGIGYEHEEDLGGFRSPSPNSPNTAWKSEGFRGYADYLSEPTFQRALCRVLSRVTRLERTRPPGRVALMCAEADPLRCHRRLIADVLRVRGRDVLHLIDPNTTRSHELTEFARVRDDLPVYPGLFDSAAD